MTDLQALTDGYLILPISMSRGQNSQNAKACYEIIEFFKNYYKIQDVDVIILYTNSLYLNDEYTTAWAAKRRLHSQMLSHKGALERLLKHKKSFSLEAVHFMAWDEVVLAAPDYTRFYQVLLQHTKRDTSFRELLHQSIGGKGLDEAHISFILEETVVIHIVRQKLVALPKKLVKNDAFRLVVYPGPYIAADLYQWKHALLPQTRDHLFYASQYNFATRTLYNFDNIEVSEGFEWQFET